MKLIYIAGDTRSGSTMLDMMISGHSCIETLGECNQLKAYASKDVRYYRQTDGDKAHEMVCYCGLPLVSCSFWRGVEKELGRPLKSLELKPTFLRDELREKLAKNIQYKIIWSLVNAITPLYSNKFVHSALDGKRIGRESKMLYDAVAATTECEYVLDSSKNTQRMYSIANEMPDSIYVVLLCRDFKGTIYSKVKRGIPMLKAALQWKWTVKQMEYYSKKMSNCRFLRIRYEDICTNTEYEMRRVCKFLNIEFQENMLKRNVEGLHHLGGSPSKYNSGNYSIKLDDSYVDKFTKKQRERLYRIVKKEADLWGYSK
jgi:hypothetical protein